MSEKLSCSIVRDLLPLYADGLTGPETNDAVKAHMEGCEECRKALRAMTEGEPEGEEEQAKETKEIDYLKKVKKRSKRTALIVACAALLVIAGVLVRFFVIGETADAYSYESFYGAIAAEGSADGKDVTLRVKVTDDTRAISKISFSETDGVVKVSLRTVPKLFFRKGEAEKTYRASKDVVRIIGPKENVLWENGAQIEVLTQRLYNGKTPYVGNAPAVGKLLGLTHFWLTGPGYSSFELQTASAPYGLKVYNVTEYKNGEKEWFTMPEKEIPLMEYNCRRHACVLLACIDNLGYYEYYAKPENLDTVIQVRVTGEEAFEYVKSLAGETELKAQNIKDFGKSAAALQQLVDILDYPNWTGF